jgi:hypothetical protein
VVCVVVVGVGGGGVIATCFLKNVRPCSYAQHWPWIVDALPGGSKVYMLRY